MPESTCPVCGRTVPVADGVYGIHYNSGLLRCDGSSQPVEAPEVEPVEKPVKKASARKKPAKP